MAEGIPVDMVEFSDNRPVLDMLLSRPLGLLALLDEESRFPRATDRTFIGKYLGPLYLNPKACNVSTRNVVSLLLSIISVMSVMPW